MKYYFAGKGYDTDTMSDEDLIVEIDMITRLSLSDWTELRAYVKELRKRIQGEVEK